MTLSLDFLALPLLGASALIFISVLAGLLSARAGFSFLLVFLVVGMLAGEDGPGGFVFNNFTLSFWVGNVALAVILLDGGLRTDIHTFRTGLRPAALLATVGVAVCAGITGVAAWWLLDLPWPMALLLGAIIGSTDAAAVFSLLKSSGVQLNERVAATLEIESGMNDPMAVYLTLLFIGIALAASPAGAAPDTSIGAIAVSLLQQFGWGAALGLGAGFGLAQILLRSSRALDGGGGIRALLLVSGGLVTFAFTTWMGGSGFLAVYIMGVVLANRVRRLVRPALSAMDGYAWLSQAGMFVLLGLLVTPSQMVQTLWPALGVALVLMLVARPISVWLCLKPLSFPTKEIQYISWVGLRGAVPIVLAVFPVMAGVPGASIFLNVAFVVVIASLLLQGSTIAWAARRLRLDLPDQDDDRAREVFGDFELDANTPLESLCAFYGLPVPAESQQSLADWLRNELHRPPVLGDSAQLGRAELSVRHLDDGRITRIGIKLD
jgi:potassium/hydrogen antiporter